MKESGSPEMTNVTKEFKRIKLNPPEIKSNHFLELKESSPTN
jgi:hypothetical protein